MKKTRNQPLQQTTPKTLKLLMALSVTLILLAMGWGAFGGNVTTGLVLGAVGLVSYFAVRIVIWWKHE